MTREIDFLRIFRSFCGEPAEYANSGVCVCGNYTRVLAHYVGNFGKTRCLFGKAIVMGDFCSAAFVISTTALHFSWKGYAFVVITFN